MQTDSCSKDVRTLKYCRWLSNSVGCSFPLWLRSLVIAEEGGSWNRGGSPFGCRAGVGAEAEAEASSTSTGGAAGGRVWPLVDHHDLQPGRRSSCSDTCLLLWWQQKSRGLENPLFSLEKRASVLKSEGARLCMAKPSVWLGDMLVSEFSADACVMVRARRVFGP